MVGEEASVRAIKDQGKPAVRSLMESLGEWETNNQTAREYIDFHISKKVGNLRYKIPCYNWGSLVEYHDLVEGAIETKVSTLELSCYGGKDCLGNLKFFSRDVSPNWKVNLGLRQFDHLISRGYVTEALWRTIGGNSRVLRGVPEVPIGNQINLSLVCQMCNPVYQADLQNVNKEQLVTEVSNLLSDQSLDQAYIIQRIVTIQTRFQLFASNL